MGDCNHKKLKCINSRKRGAYRYRRYKCECGYRHTTAEVITSLNIHSGVTGEEALKAFAAEILGVDYQKYKSVCELINKLGSA